MPQQQKTPAQNAAAVGVNKLIDHLARTGTGKEKLDVAREVLADTEGASTEKEGAQLVVTHLKRRGVTTGTIEKAEAFIAADLVEQSAPAQQFVPGATIPGTVVVAPPAPAPVRNK